jgi:hypothetical protein
MYNQLVELLGVDPKTSRIDCQHLFSDEGLTYTFMGFDGKFKDIRVPFKQFILWRVPGECEFTLNGEFDCSRGENRINCTSLGQEFLRSAYMHVNYDNLTVSIAQAAYEEPHEWPAGIEKDGRSSQAPLMGRQFA